MSFSGKGRYWNLPSGSYIPSPLQLLLNLWIGKGFSDRQDQRDFLGSSVCYCLHLFFWFHSSTLAHLDMVGALLAWLLAVVGPLLQYYPPFLISPGGGKESLQTQVNGTVGEKAS